MRRRTIVAVGRGATGGQRVADKMIIDRLVEDLPQYQEGVTGCDDAQNDPALVVGASDRNDHCASAGIQEERARP